MEREFGNLLVLGTDRRLDEVGQLQYYSSSCPPSVTYDWILVTFVNPSEQFPECKLFHITSKQVTVSFIDWWNLVRFWYVVCH